MIWFTADTHLGGQQKFWRGNGWTVEEHDEIVIDNINRCAQRDDQLYILGDFAWDKAEKWKQLIQCKHVRFVIGNHDRYEESKRAFGEIHNLLDIRLPGAVDGTYEHAVLCHYPMAFWNGSHRGWYHFYGHTHRQREWTLDSLFPERKSMDVGIDNVNRLFGEYRPISWWEIQEYLRGRNGHDDVEFYRANFGPYVKAGEHSA